jgi:hypothetical protein
MPSEPLLTVSLLTGAPVKTGKSPHQLLVLARSRGITLGPGFESLVDEFFEATSKTAHPIGLFDFMNEPHGSGRIVMEIESRNLSLPTFEDVLVLLGDIGIKEALKFLKANRPEHAGVQQSDHIIAICDLGEHGKAALKLTESEVEVLSSGGWNGFSGNAVFLGMAYGDFSTEEKGPWWQGQGQL